MAALIYAPGLYVSPPSTGGGGGGGGGLGAPVRLSTGGTLSTGQTNVYANTSGGSFTLTLPASPTDGEQHAFTDDHLAWGTSALTIAANTGQTIASLSLPPSSPSYYGATALATVQGARVIYEFDASLSRWNSV